MIAKLDRSAFKTDYVSMNYPVTRVRKEQIVKDVKRRVVGPDKCEIVDRVCSVEKL